MRTAFEELLAREDSLAHYEDDVDVEVHMDEGSSRPSASTSRGGGSTSTKRKRKTELVPTGGGGERLTPAQKRAATIAMKKAAHAAIERTVSGAASTDDGAASTKAAGTKCADGGPPDTQSLKTDLDKQDGDAQPSKRRKATLEDSVELPNSEVSKLATNTPALDVVGDMAEVQAPLEPGIGGSAASRSTSTVLPTIAVPEPGKAPEERVKSMPPIPGVDGAQCRRAPLTPPFCGECGDTAHTPGESPAGQAMSLRTPVAVHRGGSLPAGDTMDVPPVPTSSGRAAVNALEFQTNLMQTNSGAQHPGADELDFMLDAGPNARDQDLDMDVDPTPPEWAVDGRRSPANSTEPGDSAGDHTAPTFNAFPVPAEKAASSQGGLDASDSWPPKTSWRGTPGPATQSMTKHAFKHIVTPGDVPSLASIKLVQPPSLFFPPVTTITVDEKANTKQLHLSGPGERTVEFDLTEHERAGTSTNQMVEDRRMDVALRHQWRANVVSARDKEDKELDGYVLPDFRLKPARRR